MKGQKKESTKGTDDGTEEGHVQHDAEAGKSRTHTIRMAEEGHKRDKYSIERKKDIKLK